MKYINSTIWSIPGPYAESWNGGSISVNTGVVDPRQGRIQNFAKGGSWLMAMVYIVLSTMGMRSMLILGDLGACLPRKIWKIRHSDIEFGGFWA